MTQRAPHDEDDFQLRDVRRELRTVRESYESTQQYHDEVLKRMMAIESMQIDTREICNRALNVLAGRVLDAEAQYKTLITTVESLARDVQRCHRLFMRLIVGLIAFLVIVALVVLGIYVF